ncbi:MAG: hypothetical protein WBP26_05340 [Candidatus Saccharimonadales bacterium]
MAYEFVEPLLPLGSENRVSVPLDFVKNRIADTLLGSCFLIRHTSLVRMPDDELVIDTFDIVADPDRTSHSAEPNNLIPTMRIEDASDKALRGFFVDIRRLSTLFTMGVRSEVQNEQYGPVPLLGMVYSPNADPDSNEVSIVGPQRRNPLLLPHVLRLMEFSDSLSVASLEKGSTVANMRPVANDKGHSAA